VICPVLYALDDEQAEIVAALCEALVPGSSPVGPVAFIDSVTAEMEDDTAVVADVGGLVGGEHWVQRDIEESADRSLRLWTTRARLQPGSG